MSSSETRQRRDIFGHGPCSANVDLGFGMIKNGKSRAAKHGFECSVIGDPPIGFVVGIVLLDEMQFGEAGAVEELYCREGIVRGDVF
jgi:hypothetical protein